MGYKNVFLSKKAKINTKNNSLVIKYKDSFENYQTLNYPIEDLNSLVIEDNLSTLSAYTVENLAKSKTLTIICDSKKMPSAIVLPLVGNTLLHKRYRQQIKMTKPLKKKIWQRVIVNKIYNQSMVLNHAKASGKYLNELSKTVKSGDIDNVEATASIYYFNKLFGKGFYRYDSTNPINNYLNYGYAIVRATIARSVVAHGLNANIGIFHDNQFNHFNLVDDFIEPFRSLVDLYVFSRLKNLSKCLNTTEKAKLVNLQNYKVLIKGKKYLLPFAIEEYIKSYIQCLEQNNAKPLLSPKIIGLVREKYYV